MKQSVKIGVVALARKTFDYIAASEIYEGIIKDLQKVEQVDFHFIRDLVIEVEDAKKSSPGTGLQIFGRCNRHKRYLPLGTSGAGN